ncbi:type II toxin-antitoxin system HicB family antitoxin [Aerococcaceae bacterium NML191292]|nr:type II toxin-antitoxin system HicB family antitoxin [Aerococcaceae bacterium NML191292]MCW6665724.1 type II toxin-antitoxin system HicB family antitoxin [Aerococcaceae bacterium NML191219]MCW6676156.1 type II toxin-antitoxin system HicB family antitoxin [Aerococcaceae bacterium NML180378]MCW6680281.1 type II toxin-antitoxin system HicB family antitoxin [Aerococcaceae bacterium NML130460]MCW6681818.1 type II toxin-antitoxin system HicB family antitoxin [Aerococcaceae bacterium NML160702]
MTTIRKNITLPVSVYETINDYAKKSGVSFSEFLRDTALKAISQNEKLSLLAYLNDNCGYMDKSEQEEIEALNIDFEDLGGKEMTLDDLLQG